MLGVILPFSFPIRIILPDTADFGAEAARDLHMDRDTRGQAVPRSHHPRAAVQERFCSLIPCTRHKSTTTNRSHINGCPREARSRKLPPSCFWVPSNPHCAAPGPTSARARGRAKTQLLCFVHSPKRLLLVLFISHVDKGMKTSP